MPALKLACFWPGMVATWHRGLARGLLVATLFAWSLCVLLLATFIWPQWLAPVLVRLLWIGLVAAWLGTTVHSLWTVGSVLQTTSPQCSADFTRAQAEYVRGNWFDAEAILLEIVHQQPRDAESLLLLVGVLRHTQRWQPALRRLRQLELLDTAVPWQFEIRNERALIEAEMAHQGERRLSEDEPKNLPTELRPEEERPQPAAQAESDHAEPPSA